MNGSAVSVVVPTGGRQSVQAAVRSAIAQTGVEVEVLVVVNGSDSRCAELREQFRQHENVRLLLDPSQMGANASRQLGIEEASNDLIALLDDDDTWHPEKLTHQLSAVADAVPDGERSWVAASGVILARAGAQLGRAPKAFPSPFQRADAYLFKRSTARDPLHVLQTSTLLFPRELGMRIPWRPEIRRHQDWDWILRCQRLARTRFLLSPHYDVTYAVASGGSLTTTTSSQDSLAFAEEHLSDRRILGDFLLTRPFDLAIERGDLASAGLLLRRALRSARPGGWSMLRACASLARTACSRHASRIRRLRR